MKQKTSKRVCDPLNPRDLGSSAFPARNQRFFLTTAGSASTWLGISESSSCWKAIDVIENNTSSAVSEFPKIIPSSLSDLISSADDMSAALLAGAPAYRFGFLRNVTLEGIEPYLRYHMLTIGVRPELVFGGYGSIQQDLLSPDSPLTISPPDMLVSALMLEELDRSFGLPGWEPPSVRQQLQTIFDRLIESAAPTIAVNTFIVPFRSETGILAAAADIASSVSGLNDFIRSFVRQHSPRFCLMDWDRL